MSEVKRTDEIQGEILHVYDDIEEADNNLPAWWLLTFYGAVAFGLVYWFYYHEYGIGKLQPQRYADAVAAEEAQRSIVTDESLEALTSDSGALAAGQEIFNAQCVACHDTKGQGREGLGPNLTDKYWIHGGAPTDIYATITNGVAAKGMPPWAPILGEQGVKEVAAYLLTLRNTEVPGKAPEGEIWPPGAAPSATPGTQEAPEAAETGR
jgi:cytochrome c oxidase cbb3-type subunit 3